jgi:hypothetical protein
MSKAASKGGIAPPVKELTAASEFAFARRAAGLLPLAEERLVKHDRLAGMEGPAV